MVRGIITFKCTNCGETFKDYDVEYCATNYTYPQPCKYCKSIRTRPYSTFREIISILGIGNPDLIYDKIWDSMESQK